MKKNRMIAMFMSVVLAFTALPAHAEENAGECAVSDQAAYTEDSDEAGMIADEIKTDVGEYVIVSYADEAECITGSGDSNTYEFKYGQTEARKMLSRINDFRKSDDAWYWDNTDSTKIKAEGLSDLEYDYGLEKVAMLRAIEIVKNWSHTRPNGESCFTAWTTLGYPATGARGENIAYGYSTEEAVFIGWREDNCKYSGQGHRRNMLSSSFKYIGIGHVIYNGTHYWVQDFGSSPTGEAKCDPADSEYKAVFDNDGNATITKKDGSSDPKEPDPEMQELNGIVLVKNEKYDLNSDILKKLGNVTITKYKSEDKTVASVSKKGIITGKYKNDGKADTNIVAYISGSDGSLKEVAKIKVTVYKPVFKFTQTDLTYPGMSVSVNGFLSNVPEGKKVRYTAPASKADILTVNENTGVITAGNANGKVKVSVLIGEGDYAAKYTSELKVKMPKLKEEMTLKSGKSKKLTLKNVSSYNIDKIEWKVEGSAVTISTTAKNNAVKLEAFGSGEATVIAALNGIEYKTKVYVE